MNVEEKIGNLVDILWDDGKTIRQFHNATKRLISSVLDECSPKYRKNAPELSAGIEEAIDQINTKRKELGI